jgi:transcriptional regulator with XRE-family HTH domain
VDTPATRAFGAEVARLREEVGIGRADLARRISVSRSYIAQVESGTTRCRRDFAERIDKGLGAGTAVVEAWDEMLKVARYPKFFRDYPAAEAAAALLRAYEETYAYGLFQTPAYMRELAGDEDGLAGRVERQRRVLARAQPPTIAVIIGEAVLLREVGGREVMREQLDHLIEISEQGNVALQVAPIARYRGVSGELLHRHARRRAEHRSLGKLVRRDDVGRDRGRVASGVCLRHASSAGSQSRRVSRVHQKGDQRTMDLSDLVWRKSSRSNETGHCVEVAQMAEALAVRDSKDPGAGYLVLGRATFRALIDTGKAS